MNMTDSRGYTDTEDHGFNESALEYEATLSLVQSVQALNETIRRHLDALRKQRDDVTTTSLVADGAAAEKLNKDETSMTPNLPDFETRTSKVAYGAFLC